MRKTYLAWLIAIILVALPVVAFAAQHDTTTDSLGFAKNYQKSNLTISQMCEACHGDGTGGRSGVHNPTVSYSNPGVAALGRCAICHDVHESQQGKLLPERTISDFCFLCHDGTAANVDGDIDSDGGVALGYYRANNVIYGLPTGSTPGARHRVNANAINANDYGETNATSVIPLNAGGNLIGWNGQVEVLKCTSCHSAHGYQVVDPFWSKSPYPLATTGTSGVEYGWEAWVGGLKTNMYLRRRVNTSTISYYGSRWCAACHQRAMGGVIAGDRDHPIDNTMGYQWLVPFGITPSSSVIWEYDTFDNVYYFQHSWGATTGAPDPLCMNCHDDPIDVDNFGVGTNEGTLDFTYRSSFPHESYNTKFRVETGDDLCLNCHVTTSLP